MTASTKNNQQIYNCSQTKAHASFSKPWQAVAVIQDFITDDLLI